MLHECGLNSFSHVKPPLYEHACTYSRIMKAVLSCEVAVKARKTLKRFSGLTLAFTALKFLMYAMISSQGEGVYTRL